MNSKEPKVIVNLLDLKGKPFYMAALALKFKKRTTSSLMKKIKLGENKGFKKCRIRVEYGKDRGEQVTNEMDIHSFSDIRFALDAFLDKSIWL